MSNSTSDSGLHDVDAVSDMANLLAGDMSDDNFSVADRDKTSDHDGDSR